MTRRWVMTGLAVGLLGIATVCWISLHPDKTTKPTLATHSQLDASRDEPAEPGFPAVLSQAQLTSLLLRAEGRHHSPFLTLAEQAEQSRRGYPELPRLSATMIGTGRRVAWLDHRPHTEGEQFKGYLVQRIESNRAWLRHGDEVIEVPLLPEQLPSVAEENIE